MAQSARFLLVDDYVPAEPPVGGEPRTTPQPPSSKAMAHLDEFARGVQAFERFSQETTAGTRRLVDEIKANPPENLDAIIARLQEIEERNACRVKPMMASFSKNRRFFAQDPDPRYRLKALSLITRQEEAIAAALEALRDARWELMAFRAERENQQGEVFADREDLARHLDEL